MTVRKKPYNELTFTDDFMFCRVLRNNEDLCKRLVELLLDVKVDRIVLRDSQHSIERDSDSRGVRFDVYLKDEDGTVFDLEMQNRQIKSLPFRTRYYQSMIDVDHLLSGDSFKALPDTYVVFICSFDPFEEGLHKYEFRNMCVEDPSIRLRDGTAKVFINAKGRRENASDEMKAFLDYLCGQEASSDLTRDIEESIARAKKVKEWEVEYMAIGDRLYWERFEGREEGRAEAHFEDVDRLVNEGILDADRACEVLKVDKNAYKIYKAQS